MMVASERAGDGAAQQPTYEQAIAELEALVEALQRDEVAVDDLEVRVARGAELVELCRARLARAELAVEEVAGSLLATERGDGPAEPPRDEAPATGEDVPF